MTTEDTNMVLCVEDTIITIYVEVDEWYQAGGASQIPLRPGPKPAFTDPEVLTLALAREVLARRSERAFWREVATDWQHLFPHLPHRSELHRRTRWLWGALEQLREYFASRFGPGSETERSWSMNWRKRPRPSGSESQPWKPRLRLLPG